MSNNPELRKNITSGACAALLCMLAMPAMHAQTTAPGPGPQTPAPSPQKPAPILATAGTTGAASDDVIMMEVFTVDASNETGYSSEKGLSGGRLVTDLSDIAAPVAVMTKDLLEDIGGVDLSTTMDFALNSQAEMDDGNNADIFTASTEGLGRDQTRIRLRGLTGSRTVDFLEVDWNPSFYNAARTDFSLGPNAILFGNGGPGGNINIARDRAVLTRRMSKVGFEIDSENSFRTTFDYNVPIIRRKAALRIEGILSEDDGWRRFAFSDRKGYYANLAVKPFKDTLVSVSFETGKFNSQADRLQGPTDSITAWLDAGRPTGPVGPVSATAVLPAGLAIAPTRNNNGLAEANNFIFGGPYATPTERTNTRLNNQYSSPVLYRTTAAAGIPIPYAEAGAGYGTGNTFASRALQLQQEGVIDYFGTAMAGTDSYRSQDYTDFRTSIEQRLAKDVFMNAFYGRNATDRFAQTMNRVDGSFTLNGEANTQNAYDLGKMYLESRWQRDFETNNREAYGMNIAWNLKLKKSEHRMSAFIQKDVHERYYRSGVPFRLSAIRRNADGTIAQWQPIFLRDYYTVGDKSAHATMHEPTGTFADANGQTWEAAWLPDNVTSIDETSAPFIWEKNRRTYFTVYDQSYFFNRKLVFSAGYRRDRTQRDRTYYGMDPVTLKANSVAAGITNYPTYTPESKSAGLVYHFPKRISLSAGYSENVASEQETFALPDASLPPAAKSTAKDIAIRWSTESDGFNVRVNYYETERVGGYQIANDAFWDDITGDGTSLQALTTPMVAGTTLNYAITRPMAPIITSLEGSGLIDATRAATLRKALVSPFPVGGGTTDRVQSTVDSNIAPDGSKGYELRAVGNLGNFNVHFNYSYTQRQKTGHAADGLALFEELIGLVRQLPANTTLPAGTDYSNVTALVSGPTSPALTAKGMYEAALLSAYAQLDSIAEQRETEFGNRKHNANVVLRYNFENPTLKGLSVRATGTWKSKSYAQNLRTYDPVSRTITQSAVYGPEIYNAGLGLSYRLKLKRSSFLDKMTLHFDVANLFNDDYEATPIKYLRAVDAIPGVGDYEVLAIDANGERIANRWIMQAPRTYRLRVGLEF